MSTQLALWLNLFCTIVLCDVYNMEKTVSSGAQLNTLAYDCLSFLTGNTCADSFIPPGKVADFFGFQYLRDNSQNGQGHNTDFLTFAANNLLAILSNEQIEFLVNRSATQIDIVNEYAYARYPLLIALRQQLEGELPLFTLNETAVQIYSQSLYLLDANITIERAFTFSQLIASLNSSQIALLDEMLSGGFSSWTPLYESDRVDNRALKGRDHGVLLMTYLSELFGWYAGNVSADTYFAPERQANYFGSFFAKDAPAVGNQGYVIDETLTGDKGAYLMQYILDSEQSEVLNALLDAQDDDLYGIVSMRMNISLELRQYLEGSNYQDIQSVDHEKIRLWSASYGRHDGRISYLYTMAFTEIYNSLSTTQWQQMYALRGLQNYSCNDSQIYKYSELMHRPEIESTAFLFSRTGESSSSCYQPYLHSSVFRMFALLSFLFFG